MIPDTDTARPEQFSIETLASATGARLRLYTATAVPPAHGILLVDHGLAEHAARYDRFAARCAARGFHVFSHDHRGHGHTTAPDAPPRRFAGRDGVEAVLADAEAVRVAATRRHPGLPVVVFGHSMGGLIALNHAERRGSNLAGLAIWNAAPLPGLGEHLAPGVLGIERWLRGSDAASGIMPRATFNAWARAIPERTSDHDWLSSDPETIAGYGSDPLCGFEPTVSMWSDVVRLIREGGSDAGLRRLPRALPVHVLAGTQDPATRRGAAATAFAERLRALGMTSVTRDLIDGARHETLHERADLRAAALARFDAFLDRAVPRAVRRA